MIPIFLNLGGRTCVVIGGGEVGRRKAGSLLAGGAHVRLVCLEEQPADFRAEKLVWITAPYQSEHLDGAALVFAAASSEVNRRVVADARGRGPWVNAATDPESGDFFLPAVLRRGELTIAVATAGLAPVLARSVRDWLSGQIDDSFARWLQVIAELRPVIYARAADARRRDAIFGRLCAVEWLERFRRESVEEIRQAMHAEIERLLAEDSAPTA